MSVDDNEYKLLVAEFQKHISEKFEDLQVKNKEHVQLMIETQIKPLIKEVAEKSSELAADKVIKKYCAHIGVDFNQVASMHAHSLDMDYIRKKRLREENYTIMAVSLVIKGIVIAVLAAVGAKYFLPIVGG